jgi:hypothetical protein
MVGVEPCGVPLRFRKSWTNKMSHSCAIQQVCSGRCDAGTRERRISHFEPCPVIMPSRSSSDPCQIHECQQTASATSERRIHGRAAPALYRVIRNGCNALDLMEWYGLRHNRGSRFGDQQQVLCQNHLRRSGHGRDEFTTKHARLSLRVDSACVCMRVCTCGVLNSNLTGVSYLPVLPRPARAGHFRQHLTLDALFRPGQLRVRIGRGCDMSGVVRDS